MPHTVRHGMATLMAEHGYSPGQIAAHLGHADGDALALRTYIHTEGAGSVEFVDRALAGA
jgi:integrase